MSVIQELIEEEVADGWIIPDLDFWISAWLKKQQNGHSDFYHPAPSEGEAFTGS